MTTATATRTLDREQVASRMLTGFARIHNNQAYERLFELQYDEVRNKDIPIAACALGCLALGYGIKPDSDLISDEQFWPRDQKNISTDCPLNPGDPGDLDDDDYRWSECDDASNLSSVIVHLNDYHRISVEDIAAWVADPTKIPKNQR